MNFQDFIESAEAKMRREAGDGSVFTSLSKSHIFNMGDDEVIEANIVDVIEDLKEDMARGVPLPFQDITCVSRVLEKSSGKTGYILDRIVEVQMADDDRAFVRSLDLNTSKLRPSILGTTERGLVQKLGIIRVEEFTDQVVSWVVFFYGTVGPKLLLFSAPSMLTAVKYNVTSFPEDLQYSISSESAGILKQAAMISHPMNYIVEVRPELTPREARREAAGKTVSVKKAPHYVVLDYDGLQALRQPYQGGTHASPIPHHRRGHWMKLAERCRNSRALGLEKVWVRPAFVGDTQFSDAKNRYIVHLEVNRQKALV